MSETTTTPVLDPTSSDYWSRLGSTQSSSVAPQADFAGKVNPATPEYWTQLGKVTATAETKSSNAPSQPSLANRFGMEMASPFGGPVMMSSDPGVGELAKQMGPAAFSAAAATGGQALGGMTGPFAPVAVPILGAIGGGGGDVLGQMATNDGKVNWGEAGASAVLGAVPGASTAKAGAGAIAKQALKYGAAGIVAKTADTEINEGRLPTASEVAVAAATGVPAAVFSHMADSGTGTGSQAVAKATEAGSAKNAILQEGRAVGFVADPTKINPSFLNNRLASAARPDDLKAAAIISNSGTTQDVIAKGIGVDVLTPASVAKAETEATAQYSQVAAASPDIAAAIDLSKQARYDADNAWYRYNSSQPGVSLKKNPRALVPAQEASAQAAQAEQMVVDACNAAGKPELANQFQAARTQLAKIGVVKQAMAQDGEIDARVLGEMHAEGYPLTGELATVAKFANEFPAVMKPASSLSKQPGVSRSGGLLPMAGAGVGAMLGGPAGAIAGSQGPALIGAGARNFMLSSMGQRLLALPNYGSAMPDAMARFLAMGTQQAGQVNPQMLQQLTGSQ